MFESCVTSVTYFIYITGKAKYKSKTRGLLFSFKQVFIEEFNDIRDSQNNFINIEHQLNQLKGYAEQESESFFGGILVFVTILLLIMLHGCLSVIFDI